MKHLQIFLKKLLIATHTTNPQKYTLKNGVVFQSCFSGGITGHVDISFRNGWTL
jgi:hypothetical protein